MGLLQNERINQKTEARIRHHGQRTETVYCIQGWQGHSQVRETGEGWEMGDSEQQREMICWGGGM